MRILHSNIDQSVNFVENALTGFLESRYVRKENKYFICYLSSQSGCNRGCTFCHLTTTGQTSFTDALISDFIVQWHNVEQEYLDSKKLAEYCHFNFMARGEPLANKHLLEKGDFLLSQLGEAANTRNLKSKFNISTILPKTFTMDISDVFRYIHPTIYYSLYSIKKSWRDKWLPGAMPIAQAISVLKRYQDFSKKIIKIHFPFIKGENDSLNDMRDMCSLLTDFDLHCEMNIIRYNPYSAEQGEESSEKVIRRNYDYLCDDFPGKVQIIPRVGRDVAASCGTFVDEYGDV